jgi:hypothetical protein
MTFPSAISILDQAIPSVSRELLLAKLKYLTSTLSLSLDSSPTDITISGQIFVLDISTNLSVTLIGLSFPVLKWQTILEGNLARSEFDELSVNLSTLANLDRFGLFDMMHILQSDVTRVFQSSPDIVSDESRLSSSIVYLVPADLGVGKISLL